MNRQELNTLLNSPDPADRRKVVTAAGNANTDRARAILEQIATSDTDPNLRDLAAYYLHKSDAPPPPADPFSDVAPLDTPAAGPPWNCVYCGSLGERGAICSNCGAASPLTTDDDPAPVTTADPFDAAPARRDSAVLNPKNRAFAAGQGQYQPLDSARGMGCLMLFFIPFIIAGIGVLAFAFVQWNNWWQLEQSGQVTRATVIDRWISTDSEDGDSYHVEYSYVVNDRAYEGQSSVNWERYNQLEPGVTVDVLYAATNPAITSLSIDNTPFLPIFLTVFAIFWNGIVLFMVGLPLHQRGKQNRLRRDARPLPGTVIESKNWEDSDDDYTFRIRYEFRTPGGKTLTGTEQRTDNSRRGQRLPQPGETVTVAYAGDDCYTLA